MHSLWQPSLVFVTSVRPLGTDVCVPALASPAMISTLAGRSNVVARSQTPRGCTSPRQAQNACPPRGRFQRAVCRLHSDVHWRRLHTESTPDTSRSKSDTSHTLGNPCTNDPRIATNHRHQHLGSGCRACLKVGSVARRCTVRTVADVASTSVRSVLTAGCGLSQRWGRRWLRISRCGSYRTLRVSASCRAGRLESIPTLRCTEVFSLMQTSVAILAIASLGLM